MRLTASGLPPRGPASRQVADAGLPEDPEAGDPGEDPGEDPERRLGRGGPGTEIATVTALHDSK